MPIRNRRQYFVDPKVQGGLIFRTIFYWVMCLTTMAIFLICWRILTGPARLFYVQLDDFWFRYGPVFFGGLLLLPIALFDCVRWSNRFCGPLLRLRRGMRALSRGEHVQPIHFRAGDFWADFADDFNALVKRVQGDWPTPPLDDEPTSKTELASAR